MGKTLSEIDRLPERELQEYQLFYQEQPFGLWREDYRTAQISHLLAMIHRDSKTDPPTLADFMPFHTQGKSAVDNPDEFNDGSEAYLASR